MERTLSPFASSEQRPYEHQAWPRWFYMLDDTGQSKGQIFDRAEDVPDGWMTLDELNDLVANGSPEAAPSNFTAPAMETKRVLTDEQRKSAVDKLRDDNSQANLLAMLKVMQELDDSIEFSDRWGKQKLAETIVDNGGPVEADKDENNA